VASIYENLDTLEQVKSDIKSALENRGVSLDNVPFTEYGEQIENMPVGEYLDVELTEQDALLDALEQKVNVLPIKEDIDEDLTAQESLISEIQNELDNIPEVERVPVEDATATESDVLAGKIFFSGDTEIKTGTLEVPDLSATTATEQDVLQGKQFYNAQGELVEGVYVSSNKAAQIIDDTATILTASDLAGATKICSYAFYQRKALRQVEIPNTVTEIDSNAFVGCNSFTTLTFEKDSQLTVIRSSAFKACTNLRGNIEIPEGVTAINNEAFAQISYGFDHVTLPSTLTTIGSSVFNAVKLTYLTVLAKTPPGLWGAFGERNLKAIYIPKGTLEAYQTANYWKNYSSKFVELEE
jgi:hypothetical protein